MMYFQAALVIFALLPFLVYSIYLHRKQSKSDSKTINQAVEFIKKCSGANEVIIITEISYQVTRPETRTVATKTKYGIISDYEAEALKTRLMHSYFAFFPEQLKKIDGNLAIFMATMSNEQIRLNYSVNEINRAITGIMKTDLSPQFKEQVADALLDALTYIEKYQL